MTGSIEILINTDTEQRAKMGEAWELVTKAIKAGPVLLTLSRPDAKRSLPQNSKQHAMYADIQKTGVITMPGKRIAMSNFDADEVKALCVVWFANERSMEGRPLTKPPRNISCPVTGQPVTIRPSTTDWGKRDTAEYIEFLYSLGADAGVQWSEPALQAFAQYREASQ